jgi:hypothetical protein
MPIKNLLFVDTNILLDFYRARNETGLQLLGRVAKLSDRLIVTYQLEMEFKKNRQAAILESIVGLGISLNISRPGVFSDSKATKAISRNLKEAEKHAHSLKNRLIRALEHPTKHDPVYKICQRLFHKQDDLVLTRDNPIRRAIANRALRRFLHGAPPRKERDTSMGDAFNWEWMVHCAIEKGTGLVIVSRDSDYGITINGRSFVNDHLWHEFSKRVSHKRELILVPSLSKALKLFEINVSLKEERIEKDLEGVAYQNLSRLFHKDFVLGPVAHFPNVRISDFLRRMQVSGVGIPGSPEPDLLDDLPEEPASPTGGEPKK